MEFRPVITGRDILKYTGADRSETQLMQIKLRLLDTQILHECIKKYKQLSRSDSQKSSNSKQDSSSVLHYSGVNADKNKSHTKTKSEKENGQSTEGAYSNPDVEIDKQFDSKIKSTSENHSLLEPIWSYWRGDVPLITSYWVVSIIVASISFAIFYIQGKIYSTNTSITPSLYNMALYFTWFSYLLLVVWHFVGLWRSASNYIANQNTNSVWGYLTQLIVVIGALRVLEFLFYPAAPELSRSLFNNVYEAAVIPDYRIMSLDYNHNVRELKIDGGLKLGLYDELKRRLDSDPQISAVEFNSAIGSPREAILISRLLSEKRINTVVNDKCSGACVIAFSGGNKRWVGVDGQLGFDSTIFKSPLLDAVKYTSQNDIQEVLSRNNISQSFFDKVSSISRGVIWYPDAIELYNNNFITSIRSEAGSSKLNLIIKLSTLAHEKNISTPQIINDNYTLDHVSASDDMFTYVYQIKSKPFLRQIIKSDKDGKWEGPVRNEMCKVHSKLIQNGAIFREMYIIYPTDTYATHYIDVSKCSGTT
jgi:hypothetical protein